MEFLTLKQIVALNASKFADKTAFKMREGDGYRSITYQQVAEIVGRLQAELKKRGVKPGERVALISENRPEWPIAYFAIASMAAVAVPLDAMLRREEFLPLMEDSDPVAMICSSKYAEYVKGTKWENSLIFMEDYNQLPAVSGKVDNPVELDTLAAIVYTSGTTGDPKGVVLTHRNITGDIYLTLKVVKIHYDDIWLSVLPLHHTFESSVGLLGAFINGCTTVYAESLKAHSVLQNMQDNRATVMCGVPRLYQLFYEGIIKEAAQKKMLPVFKLLFGISGLFRFFGINIGRQLFSIVHSKFGGRIRLFIAGGAAMDHEVLKAFALMGFNVTEGYGLTETAPIIACNTIEVNRLGSVGKVIPEVTVKIDEEKGEILAKGPNVMKGYYKRQRQTDEVIIDGWFHTGDVGRFDKDGFLYITGRCKDVIVTAAGVNVYPDEIEYWLKKVPAIKEVCVLGVKLTEGPHKGSEVVAAVVVPEEGRSEEEVKTAINEINKKHSHDKRISRIIFRQEELPKTRLQKVKKFELKKEMGL